jgi:hypothetical protein
MNPDPAKVTDPDPQHCLSHDSYISFEPYDDELLGAHEKIGRTSMEFERQNSYVQLLFVVIV